MPAEDAEMLEASPPSERAPSMQNTDGIQHEEEEYRKVEERKPITPRGKTTTPVPGAGEADVDADDEIGTEEIKTKEEEDDDPETPRQQTTELVRTHSDAEEALSRGSSADTVGAGEKDVDVPDHPGSDDDKEDKEEPVVRRSRRSTSGVPPRYMLSSLTRTRVPIF